MKPDAKFSVVLVEAGAGQLLRAFGEEVIVHLGGKETGGTLALWTEITPPGGGPPPHYHENETKRSSCRRGALRFIEMVSGRNWGQVELHSSQGM
jgi:hypothetical protein